VLKSESPKRTAAGESVGSDPIGTEHFAVQCGFAAAHDAQQTDGPLGRMFLRVSPRPATPVLQAKLSKAPPGSGWHSL